MFNLDTDVRQDRRTSKRSRKPPSRFSIGVVVTIVVVAAYVLNNGFIPQLALEQPTGSAPEVTNPQPGDSVTSNPTQATNPWDNLQDLQLPFGGSSPQTSAEEGLVTVRIKFPEAPVPLLPGIQLPMEVGSEVELHKKLFFDAFLKSGTPEVAQDAMFQEALAFEALVATYPAEVRAAKEDLRDALEETARDDLSPASIYWVGNAVFGLEALGYKVEANALLEEATNALQSPQAQNAFQAEPSSPPLEPGQAKPGTGRPSTGTSVRTPEEALPVLAPIGELSFGIGWSAKPILWQLKDLWNLLQGDSVTTEKVWFVVLVESAPPQGTYWFGLEEDVTLNYIFFSQNPGAIPFEGGNIADWLSVKDRPVKNWYGTDLQGNEWWASILLWYGLAPFEVGDVVTTKTLSSLFISAP